MEDVVDLNHPGLGHVQRVEQRGDRVVVTGGGVVHDMRCDGTLERGVHVLRPEGMPVEVTRSRRGKDMIWEYLGFTARLEYLAPSATDPAGIDGLDRAR